MRAGDAVFFAAGGEAKAAALAGKARARLGEELGVGDKDQFAFAWITDFPMYEWDEDEKKIEFSHNPFSMPNIEPAQFLALDQADKDRILALTAFQYDIVCNGYEIASGAIRNHRPDVMKKAFGIAGYAESVLEERFGGMYRAFQYGAPPHGGMAAGIDRIVMLLCGAQNLREITMFPMNQRAEDLLLGAPSEVDAEAAARAAHPPEPAGEVSPVTAIVVAHDSAHALPACLDALGARACRRSWSTMRAKTAPRSSRKRAGRASSAMPATRATAARTTSACAAAESELVLILNPDLALDSGAAAALLAASERYPDAGILAPRIVEPDGPRVLPAAVAPLALSRQSARQALPPEGDCCAPFLSGACLMVRRELFLALGGFDPNIFLFYEDDDLCRRVADAGACVGPVHGAIARHLRGGSSAPKAGRVFRARWHQAWSRAYVARKYGLPNPAPGCSRSMPRRRSRRGSPSTGR